MDTPNVNSEMPAKAVVDSAAPRVRDTPKSDVESLKQKPKIDPVLVIENLSKAVEVLNEAMARDPIALKFTIDDTLNRPVVTVISEKTGKVLHQLPQEEVLRAVKNIDLMRGVLFEDKG